MVKRDLKFVERLGVCKNVIFRSKKWSYFEYLDLNVTGYTIGDKCVPIYWNLNSISFNF